jgi:GT2 family glycosyltransferase
MGLADTTVIIPTYNGIAVLETCLRSLATQKYQSFSVLIIDNGSTDGTTSMIEKVYPSASVLRFESNLGFAKAVNKGIRSVVTPFVLLLNNDTVVESDFIGILVCSLRNSPKNVAAINPMVLNIDGSAVENCGFFIDKKWRAHHIAAGVRPNEVKNEPAEIFGVNAGATIFKLDFLLDVGCFDDDFFAYYEDVDLSIRGKAKGWKYFSEPTARVFHHHSHTGNSLPGLKSFYLRRNYLWYVIKNASILLATKLILSLVVKDVGKTFHYLKSLDNRNNAKIILNAYLATVIALGTLMKKRISYKVR